MNQLISSFGEIVESIFFGFLVLAGVYLLLSALYIAVTQRSASTLRRVVRHLLLAFFAGLLIKNFFFFNRRMLLDPYDGTRATFIKRNLLWFDERSEIRLRKDHESSNPVWMAQDKSGRWYPFFVESEY
jgi:hypothetical protein